MMTALIFDGRAFAKEREERLARLILDRRLRLRMASVVFVEDKASVVYSSLKKRAAVRVGVEFEMAELSLATPIERVRQVVEGFSERSDIDGVMVQKPMKDSWFNVLGKRGESFESWWQRVVGNIALEKDVDCLTAGCLARIYQGEWKVLPATARAVVSILAFGLEELGSRQSKEVLDLRGLKVVVVGRSEIVGRPLAAVLERYGAGVELVGKEFDRGLLFEADIVVSATGVQGLIEADMVKERVIVIDVGSPGGDVVFDEVKQRASFITPVPGGVGPVTVVSLLENLVELVTGGVTSLSLS